MKIDTIYHSKDSRRKECKGDKAEKKYSKDPVHHPFLLEREYVRALNATKMERMFAKPFIAALSHHREGINKLTKDCNSSLFASSSYDNKCVVWDLLTRQIVSEHQFSSQINSIALGENSDIFVSQYKSVFLNYNQTEYVVESTVNSIDYSTDLCVGFNSGLSVFDINRLTPKYTYDFEDCTAVKYNASFKYVIGALSRLNIKMYDNRSNKEFITIEAGGSNALAFNPQQGYMFATANEDGNGYYYDIRNPEKPVETYRGHTNAVVSISFNPNGKEIVTGSFDKTIRIFNLNDRKARDCYYNDRMQIVHGVEYSNDGNFIISGSDDGNLRLWKAQASKKSGPVSKAEKEASEYAAALKDKFKNVNEIARISKHRFLNKEIKQEMRIKHEKYEGSIRRAAKKDKEAQFRQKSETMDDDSE